MEELVSIIIPVYNCGEYLYRCIDSVRNQTYRKLEILLVDDGSTDDCYKICEKYRLMDRRVHVIHKGNGGLVSARKTGITLASGKYIAWVDGDDWIEPYYIEQLVMESERTGADIVSSDLFFDIGDSVRIEKNGFFYGIYKPEELYSRLLYTGEFYRYGVNPHIYTKLIRRTLIAPVQLEVDERIVAGEDAAVIYPCVLAAEKISIANICGYHYVQHPGSMTKSNNEGELERDLVLFQYLENVFLCRHLSDIFKHQMNQYKKYFMILRMIEALDNPESDEVLKPYGGISAGSRVVLYGAGGVGQRIYRYLSSDGRVEIADWLDRSYISYRAYGMKVNAPEQIVNMDTEYDYVIIANIDGNTADAIRRDLIQMGVESAKIKWFSEDFLAEEYEAEIFVR